MSKLTAVMGSALFAGVSNLISLLTQGGMVFYLCRMTSQQVV